MRRLHRSTVLWILAAASFAQVGSWALSRNATLEQALVPMLRQSIGGQDWEALHPGFGMVVSSRPKGRLQGPEGELSHYLAKGGYVTLTETEGRARHQTNPGTCCGWIHFDILLENPLFAYVEIAWGGYGGSETHHESYPLWWTPAGWTFAPPNYDTIPGRLTYGLLDRLVELKEAIHWSVDSWSTRLSSPAR